MAQDCYKEILLTEPWRVATELAEVEKAWSWIARNYVRVGEMLTSPEFEAFRYSFPHSLALAKTMLLTVGLVSLAKRFRCSPFNWPQVVGVN